MSVSRSRFCLLGASCVLLAAIIGACGTAIDARFELSDDPDVFGTLIDDRGTFEFIRNPETGNIQRVNNNIGEASGPTFPPTDGQDFSITRDDGGSLTLQPAGAEDVLVVVRGDPVVDDVDLQVTRDSLGPLGTVVRQENGGVEQCEANQEFVDGACAVTLSVDLVAVVDMVRADLTAGAENIPSAETLRTVLSRYLVLLSECCLAWDELEGSVCEP